MTTRRTFIKGVGAGLLLPSWDFLVRHNEQYGEPLLRAPPTVDHILFATRWSDDFQFSLDRIDDDYPSPEMSIKDFIVNHLGGNDPDCWETSNYEEPIGHWFVEEIWPYHYSADAQAFYFLSSLESQLGFIESSTDVHEGYVDFIEGPCPGNDSRLVCADALGVSILQDRLVSIGYNVLIKPT